MFLRENSRLGGFQMSFHVFLLFRFRFIANCHVDLGNDCRTCLNFTISQMKGTEEVPTPVQDFDVELREAAKRGARDLQQKTPGVNGLTTKKLKVEVQKMNVLQLAQR